MSELKSSVSIIVVVETPAVSRQVKILIAIPHVFNPEGKSIYSSNDRNKRAAKQRALYRATIENLGRHNQDAWIHVARKCDGKIITRKIDTSTKK